MDSSPAREEAFGRDDLTFRFTPEEGFEQSAHRVRSRYRSFNPRSRQRRNTLRTGNDNIPEPKVVAVAAGIGQ